MSSSRRAGRRLPSARVPLARSAARPGSPGGPRPVRVCCSSEAPRRGSCSARSTSGGIRWTARRVERLTDFEGAEHHAAISRDGKFVAFLSDREGTWDAWATQVGIDDLHNLTKGSVQELRNPGTRTLVFIQTGRRSSSGVACRTPPGAGWSMPGGRSRRWAAPFDRYLPGISELDWSPDGRRIVYHPPTEGDPLFVTEPDEKSGRQIYVARKGFHNHFPVWSPDGAFIYFVHGLVHGLALDKSDVWRIRPAGGEPERLTFHDSRVTFPTLLGNRTLLYLATDDEGSGPWIYAMDVEPPRSPPHQHGRRGVPVACSQCGWSTPGRDRFTLDRRPVASADCRPRDRRNLAPRAISLPTARGLSPRAGRGYIIYRAPKAGTDGLMKLVDGTSSELWSGADGRALGGPAISPDGQRLAFLVQRRGLTQLYVMNADGSGARRIAERARRARSARLVAGWAVAGGRGQSGWRAAAVQDPGQRRGAGSAREGVLNRSDLGSERTVSRLFRRGCRYDVFGEGGERGRDASPTAEPDSDPGRQAPGLSGEETMRWSS